MVHLISWSHGLTELCSDSVHNVRVVEVASPLVFFLADAPGPIQGLTADFQALPASTPRRLKGMLAGLRKPHFTPSIWRPR
jgi:hypothetical protein